MQKFLALLLLIGLINGMSEEIKGEKTDAITEDKVQKETQRLFTVADEETQKAALKTFETCVNDEASDNTTCFTNAMASIETVQDKEVSELARYADKIVGCKNGNDEDLAECIRNLGDNKQLEVIAQSVEFFEKVNESIKQAEEEAKKTKEEFFDCSTNEKGIENCNLKAEFEKELADAEEKAKKEFETNFKTVKISPKINGKEETIEIVIRTKEGYKKAIEECEASVAKLEEQKTKATEEEKKTLEQFIEVINQEITDLKEKKDADLAKITADYEKNIEEEKKFFEKLFAEVNQEVVNEE